MVLAVNAWDETKDSLKKFVTEGKLRQRVLVEGSTVAAKFNVDAVPATYFIDRNGKITHYVLGADAGALKRYAAALVSP